MDGVPLDGIFGDGTDSDDAVIPSVENPNFLEALRTRVMYLAPELSNVYLSSSDPQAEQPFLIISKLWEDTIETSVPSEYYKEVNLQFTLFSFSDVEAEYLGKRIFRGLKPHPNRPSLGFYDGYEMGRHPGRLTGPTDSMDDPVGDQKVWRVMFDFTWDIGMNEDD